MNILFIGGTGIISTACTRLAVERGFHLTLLNRARRPVLPGARQITADMADLTSVKSALGNQMWDVVVDFIAFKPAEIEQRLALFKGRTGQYVFISSASAYQKPLGHWLVTESTPLANPFWDYSRDKIACEELLLHAWREEHFPMTIARPSLTYGDTTVPIAVNSWLKSYTVVDRMRRGLPVIVPGDGLSLWTITHNSDFAKGLIGLLGREDAMGDVFQITSDEVLTWNQMYQLTAKAAGVSDARLVHITSDYITACIPEMTGSLLGDKSHSAVFDNSKIKRFVPDFLCTTRFHEGIARTIAWFDADPARRQIDEKASANWDRLIAGYERGLAAARREFAL
ncbi:MAG TPA: NAD-dependent epimerase/dehydratase family protein [Verrucomicrobiae bacterium]|nr:NAD-dependent epimerase/dehydratase family protein [Verrucomicrobiae bacterium]